MKAVLVDVPVLFDRPGLYAQDGHDYPDNALRFAVLARAALEYARLEGERYDVIHAHDWQTGLVPVYQKMLLSTDPVVGGVPAVFTIHNLAFQGVFGPDTVNQLGLGWDVFNAEGPRVLGKCQLPQGRRELQRAHHDRQSDLRQGDPDALTSGSASKAS